MCEILTYQMFKGLHHEMGFLHLHSGCFKIFKKHLKKNCKWIYVCVAKRCWIKGTYLFNFVLLPIGRQGIADIFSALRLLPLAA
jgi:hypothetical protein